MKNYILLVRHNEAEASLNTPRVESVVFQGRSISGRVVSGADNQPLPGVSGVIRGTQSGTVTDVDGNYRITVPSDDAVLVFTFIGYKATEVPVGARSTIDVTLESDVTQLSEVVVTSFGIEQEKQSLGFSVQELGSAEITQMKQPNIVS